MGCLCRGRADRGIMRNARNTESPCIVLEKNPVSRFEEALSIFFAFITQVRQRLKPESVFALEEIKFGRAEVIQPEDAAAAFVVVDHIVAPSVEQVQAKNDVKVGRGGGVVHLGRDAPFHEGHHGRDLGAFGGREEIGVGHETSVSSCR